MNDAAEVVQETQVADSTEAEVVEQSTEQSAGDAKIVVLEDGTKQQIIEVQNPTPEEQSALLESIKDSYNFDVFTKPVDFNFKKSTDKDTGIETIRKAVRLVLPFPTVQGIINILEVGSTEEGKKQLELLQEAIEGVVTSRARDLLYDDLSLTAATFPVDKVSWQAISELPRTQRRGGGIPKETWEAFGQDYVDIMQEATGKTIDQVGNAAKILVNKFNQVKTNKPILNMLAGQLAIYAEHTKNLEDYQECVDFLLSKAETLLSVSDEDMLANL